MASGSHVIVAARSGNVLALLKPWDINRKANACCEMTPADIYFLSS
jgi:hypothetical protein